MINVKIVSDFYFDDDELSEIQRRISNRMSIETTVEDGFGFGHEISISDSDVENLLLDDCGDSEFTKRKIELEKEVLEIIDEYFREKLGENYDDPEEGGE